jgi:DnaJ-class molecular chaperone
MTWPASLYALLGADTSADAAALRAAYERALAALPKGRWQRLRLALCGRSAASLDHAWQILSDPRRRATYDRLLQVSPWTAYLPPGH